MFRKMGRQDYSEVDLVDLIKDSRTSAKITPVKIRTRGVARGVVETPYHYL